jgi:hypothetical protein
MLRTTLPSITRQGEVFVRMQPKQSSGTAGRLIATMLTRNTARWLAITLGVIGATVTQTGCYPEIRTSSRRVTYAKLALNEMGRAIESFKRDVGRYPTTSQGLTALVQNDGKTPGWNGPYLPSVPADP